MFYIRTLWLNHITRNRKVSRKAVFFFFQLALVGIYSRSSRSPIR